MAGLIVIAYDGSAGAQYAVDVAGRIVRPTSALVITAWHLPVAAVDTSVPPLGTPTAPSLEDEDDLERRAEQTAEEGAARARAAGLEAEARVVRGAAPADIAKTLFDVAEDRDADLVIVGRRGLSRVKSIVLGSVSEAAVRDGRRPVLVVPAQDWPWRAYAPAVGGS